MFCTVIVDSFFSFVNCVIFLSSSELDTFPISILLSDWIFVFFFLQVVANKRLDYPALIYNGKSAVQPTYKSN